jgi:ADP-ribose diphosphatase
MESKPDTWQRRSSKKVADCRVFTVREDDSVRASDGREGRFFVIESRDWVNVIAMTVDQRVVLIEQFRHGVEEAILEIPGGMIDPGEDALNAAKRELAEETGYTSDDWTFLGKSRPNPAIQKNEIFHYLAAHSVQTLKTQFDEHESITTRLLSLDDVSKLIAAGEITHSLVIAAFYFLSVTSKQ